MKNLCPICIHSPHASGQAIAVLAKSRTEDAFGDVRQERGLVNSEPFARATPHFLLGRLSLEALPRTHAAAQTEEPAPFLTRTVMLAMSVSVLGPFAVVACPCHACDTRRWHCCTGIFLQAQRLKPMLVCLDAGWQHGAWQSPCGRRGRQPCGRGGRPPPQRSEHSQPEVSARRGLCKEAQAQPLQSAPG